MGVNSILVFIGETEIKRTMKTRIMKTQNIFLAIAFCFATGGALAQDQNTTTEQQPPVAGEEQPFQLSLFPGVGTNFKPAGRAINYFSINLFAGYNYGVKGVELGGFLNIDRSHVEYAQLSGFGNLVGGNVTGLQAAGFLNANKGELTKGAQLSGFLNLTKNVTGTQMAGFTNIAIGDLNGAQLSGFYNHARLADGAQLAGFHNYARSVDGAQVSGFANIAIDSVKGAQVSGFFNQTKNLDGVQIAGFVNQAKTVKGVQIGVINIADTVERGATIGLINIVRRGMHQFEISHNDITDLNLEFKSGTPRFYGIIGAGLETKEDGFWGFGGGFGTQFTPFANNVYTGIEAKTLSLHTDGSSFENNFNMLNRLQLNVGYQLTKTISVNAGPVLNIYTTNMYNADSQTYGYDIGRNPFFDEQYGNKNVRMWVGYHAGVRF